MNAEDLKSLAERASTVQGRQIDRLAEVHGRIKSARRRRVGAAGAGAAGAVLALAIANANLTGSSDRSQDPVDNPTSPVPAPTETVAEPKGQATITTDIAPADIQRWDEGITKTTAGDPGATELNQAVAARSLYFALEGFCRGGQDTWWVLTSSYGQGGYGQCGADATLSAPPPEDVSAADPFTPEHWTSEDWAGWDVSEDQNTLGTEQFWEVGTQMFLTDEISQEQRDCFDEPGSIDMDPCMDGLKRLQSTDATFGFTLYQELAPHVATVLGQGFEALAVVDGTDYLFSKAVVAPDADTLTLTLESSDRPRLVGLLQRGDQAAELRIDGRRPADGDKPPLFASPGVLSATTLVPPGAHTITVNRTGENTKQVGMAVVVYEASP